VKKKYICWQEDDIWIGYLEEYPDYWTPKLLLRRI
jgi:hypothetical protein